MVSVDGIPSLWTTIFQPRSKMEMPPSGVLPLFAYEKDSIDIQIIQDFPDEVFEDDDLEINPKIKLVVGQEPVQNVGCYV